MRRGTQQLHEGRWSHRRHSNAIYLQKYWTISSKAFILLPNISYIFRTCICTMQRLRAEDRTRHISRLDWALSFAHLGIWSYLGTQLAKKKLHHEPFQNRGEKVCRPHSPCTKDPRSVSIQQRPGRFIGGSNSDMEVLGAAAAISQFLVQLIATVGLAKKLKGASNSLRQYQERLNDLKLLCEVIRNNPALDTEKVQKETQSILDIIKTHKYVPNLLEKGSFRRAITFILKEQSFGDLFATLEDKKTTLSLVVLSINSLALHDINLRIMSMSVSAAFGTRIDRTHARVMYMLTSYDPVVSPVPGLMISRHLHTRQE